MAVTRTKQAAAVRRYPVARGSHTISGNAKIVSQRDFALIVHEIENPSKPTEEMRNLAALYRKTIKKSR